MKKAVISLCLVLSLTLSTPAFAVTPELPGETITTSAYTILGSISLDTLYQAFNSSWTQWLADTLLSKVAYSCKLSYALDHHAFCTFQSLENLSASLNANYGGQHWMFKVEPLPGTSDPTLYCIHMTRMSWNNNFTNKNYVCLADGTGRALVAVEDNNSGAVVQSPDILKPYNNYPAGSTTYHLLDLNTFSNKRSKVDLGSRNISYELYQISRNDGMNVIVAGSHGDYILCDPSGVPYAYATESSSVNSGDREATIIVDEQNNIETNVEEQHIDTTLDFSSFDFSYVDNSDHSISVAYYDSHDQTYYVYDTENNYYSYQYYIDYTYVYNIGQTDTFEAYKCYYKLPDGRSSSELTKEELEQLNLNIDVINYIPVQDTSGLRALYHFDGNLDDVSYYGSSNSASWTNNGSITYMDSGSFNGSLYIPSLPTDTALSLRLSSAARADLDSWTLEFRFYQQSVGTFDGDYWKLYLFSKDPILSFSSDNVLSEPDDSSVTAHAATGVWNSVAIVHSAGSSSAKLYLNGLSQTSIPVPSFTGSLIHPVSDICFAVLGGSQAYTCFDEVRFSSSALYSSQYTPSQVPFDTNLSLVLPDFVGSDSNDFLNSAGNYSIVDLPELADQNLLSSLSNLDSSALVTRNSFDEEFSLVPLSASAGSAVSSIYYCFDNSSIPVTLRLGFDNPDVSYVTSSLAPSYHLNVSSGLFNYSTHTSTSVRGLSFYDSSGHPVSSTGFLCFFVDGYDISPSVSPFISSSSSSPIYFSITESSSEPDEPDPPEPEYGSLVVRCVSDGDPSQLFNFVVHSSFGGSTSTTSITIRSNDSASIDFPVGTTYTVIQSPNDLYLTTSSGATGTISADSISSCTFTNTYLNTEVEDPDDPDHPSVPQTVDRPVLAVKSDIPVSDYQIGGVRPVYPVKGIVYALVESGYITSCQIYTGYAWVEVDARIWTGSRWIPYNYFNIITLSDMYDIVDASGNMGYEYIYTDYGFWNWWQKAWTDFVQLFTNRSGSVSDQSIINIDLPSYSDPISDYTVVDAVDDSGKGVWRIFKAVIGIVGNVFEQSDSAADALSQTFSSAEDSTDSVFNIFSVPYEEMSVSGGE